ncbi:MAG TPA: sensor histidine kinase [Nitrobacter sp.]|jgi:two-component sensor histidine kinase|nr:sensor histidine kinase [Nitrobacter sp.]
MTKWTDEFRRGWQGIAEPPLVLSLGLAAVCLVASTVFRYSVSLIRPDVPFTPYLPGVFVATAFGGLRAGIAAGIGGAVLALILDFGAAPRGLGAVALVGIYTIVASLILWGLQHYRSLLRHQRELAARLRREESYRELVVEELQHRLKNKLASIHSVIRQALHDQPAAWERIDGRLRALALTDDLITEADGRGCDIRDLLRSELGPYDHVRFTLNGDPLFLPAKLAVSLALMFHELATNAAKYGAFSAPNGMLHVSWTVTNGLLSIVWDESEGPMLGPVEKKGFGTQLLQAGLRAFDGKTEIAYLATGLHCMMQCRIPEAKPPPLTR